MSTTDITNKAEAAVEKALRLQPKPDQTYSPKDRQSLSNLILELEDLNREAGERIANAKHVLTLILGGLK